MKISAVFLALVLISLAIFQAQTAQAHEIKEGVVTQERSQAIEILGLGALALSALGLGSIASIPILGTIISAILGIFVFVGFLATGGAATGFVTALILGIILVALGPIGILIILAIGGGGTLVTVLGIGGVLLLALLGPILAVIGIVILILIGVISVISVILSPIIALMSVLCAPLGAIVGGAGAVAGGFSLFAGGAGAITGITLFGLEGILAFCANFPVSYQIIMLCCYPFLMLFNACLPYIDMLCAPIIALCGSLIEPVFMLICAPIIELCAGAGLVRVIS